METITRKDVEKIDKLAFTIVDEIEKMIKDSNPTEFDEYSDFTFSACGSDGIIRPLFPGGIDKKVTYSDCSRFRELLIQYHLNEFNEQCAAIRRGLATIIPYRILPLLSWKELEMEVCGSPIIDIALLKAHTKYSGYTQNQNVIKYFWEMMETRLSQDELTSFLAFVWGRRRLPLKGANWEMPFKIARKYCSNPNSVFPIAHTCSFAVDLPEYTSCDIMTDKFKWAMEACNSIDAD